MNPARRRFLTAAGLALCGPSMLSGCQPTRSPLRIASHVWPGYEPMFLARREGWLDADFVRLVETPSATDSLNALAAGFVDGAALTLDEVLRARAGQVPLSVVLVFDVSAGADMLLARPGIGLDDLRGRRIGAEYSALGAVVLSEALQAAGLEATDITLVPLAIHEQYAAWQSGQVDAVVTYEPVSRQLLAEGAVRLFDSRDMPDLIVDVLAVRQDVLKRQRPAVAHLLAAHFRALEHLSSHPQDAAHRMAPRMQLPPAEVLMSFRGLVLPDRADNRRLLAGPSPALLASARRLSDIMVGAGILAQDDSLQGLIEPAFLMQD